jgi:hypothetical protein
MFRPLKVYHQATILAIKHKKDTQSLFQQYISILLEKLLCILFVFYTKYFTLMTFYRSKHVAPHDIHLVVLTVYNYMIAQLDA